MSAAPAGGRRRLALVALCAALVLPACDQIRFPGDNRDDGRDEAAPQSPPPPPAPPGDPAEPTGGEETGGDPATPTPLPPPPPPPAFSYYPAGNLIPGSGEGATDHRVWVEDMVFPIKDAPAYLQSQVWRFGGGVAGGDQCDARNYAYPWRDNFCESRSRERDMPYCPQPRVHQGQDIRVGTPAGCEDLRRTPAAERDQYAVVAAEDGVISEIGTYTVKLRSPGTVYRYMHLNMDKLEVALDQSVSAGDVLGYVSNDFGGTPTTFHLHFEMITNTDEHGWAFVPPYMSLVAAYERREGGPGAVQPVPEFGPESTPVPIPEGLEIIE